MKLFFIFIFLLSLKIKTINNKCSHLFGKKYLCGILTFHCDNLSSDESKKINCKRGNNCYLFKQCFECISGYYLSRDEETCFKIENEPEVSNPPVSSNGKTKCHPHCLDCKLTVNNDDMNCINCKNNFYKIDGTNNCYNITILNNGFYLKNEIFYPCDEKCLTCSDGKNGTSSNCLSCDSEYLGLYLLEDKNNCEYSNFSGYYLHSDSKTLKKCYRSCKTCNGPYEINNENHNCIVP